VIISIIKSLINLIYLNLFLLLNKKKKIIFFYHPRKELTLIHTYYFEDLFTKFPKDFKVFYGHNCDGKIGKDYYYLKERFLRYLFNVDFFLCNNICDNFTNKSLKIYFHHNIYDDPWVSIKKEKTMCGRLIKYDFIFVASEKSQLKVSEMFKKYDFKNIPKIVDTGYLKLDYILKNFRAEIDNKKDAILIAPTEFEGFPELSIINKIKKIIEILLKDTNRKIILRPHPRNRKLEIFTQIKNEYLGNDRFIFDDSENYVKTYTRSDLMITDMSGTAYTFAFISLCPVIFFSVSEEHLKQNNYNSYSFYKNREVIGKIIFDENELINTVDYLIPNKVKFKNNITNLRSEMKYCNKSTERLIDIFKSFS